MPRQMLNKVFGTAVLDLRFDQISPLALLKINFHDKKQDEPYKCGALQCWVNRQVWVYSFFDFGLTQFHHVAHMPRHSAIFAAAQAELEQGNQSQPTRP